MAIVVDASVTLAWGLPGEESAYGDGVLLQVLQDGARVPAIWTIEVANATLMAERARRFSANDADAFLAHVSGLCLRRQIVVVQVAPSRVFAELPMLSREFRLTAYDACYLHLARTERLPLASLDATLVRAARKVGIPICDTESSLWPRAARHSTLSGARGGFRAGHGQSGAGADSMSELPV